MANPVPTSETKDCPFCAEPIKAAAILCRYCKSPMPEEVEATKPTAVEAEIVDFPIPGEASTDDTVEAAREAADVLIDESRRGGIGGLIEDGGELLKAYQESPEAQDAVHKGISFLESISLGSKKKKEGDG